MHIKLTVNGDIQLSRNLRTLVTQLPKMEEFFNDALDLVEKRTDDIFAAQ